MSNRDLVQVGARGVDRKALDAMGLELRDHQAKKNRLAYLKVRFGEIVHESPTPPDGMPRGSAVSNPTLSKIMRMDQIGDEMAEISAWLHGIWLVMNSLTEWQQEIMRQMYLLSKGEREYTVAEMAKRLNMSERKIYYARDEALVEFIMVLHGKEALHNPCGYFSDCFLKPVL
jgi:hypothetical protein